MADHGASEADWQQPLQESTTLGVRDSEEQHLISFEASADDQPQASRRLPLRPAPFDVFQAPPAPYVRPHLDPGNSPSQYQYHNLSSYSHPSAPYGHPTIPGPSAPCENVSDSQDMLCPAPVLEFDVDDTSAMPWTFHRPESIKEEHQDAPSSVYSSSTAPLAPSALPAPLADSYMGRASPFELESVKRDESFLEWFPKGDATITYPNEHGDLESLTEISPWIFRERCPLLAEAFEETLAGPKLHLDILTTKTARPFLRYLYTGSYAIPGPDGDIYEDCPTSLLMHCELFRLGDIYDSPDLKQQAYVNVTRQCEFGCSSPDKPIDLCSAITYTYEHLHGHANIVETIICYCVACFLRHRLADNFEFRKMAYDLRPFHQDLCTECRKRNYEDDDIAAAIIQMPFKPYAPATYASREDVQQDVVYHFHGEDEVKASPHKRQCLEPHNKTMQWRHQTPLSWDPLREADNNPGQGLLGALIKARNERVYRKGQERAGSEQEDTKSVEKDPFSDPEYEVLGGPAPVEALSSSDEDESDGDTIVVAHPATPASLPALQRQGLPDRSREPVSLSGPAPARPSEAEDGDDGDDGGSDSEWTLL